MWKTPRGEVFIRSGLAFSFIYAAIGGFTKSENWIGWFPRGVRELWPSHDSELLMVWGVLEMLVALWLLSGWHIRISGFVAASLLFGIAIANWSSMDIVFRDIALGLIAVGLALSARRSIEQ